MGAGATRVDAAKPDLAEAEARLRLVLLDGSMGFHNVEKAERLLQASEAVARDAGQRLFGGP